jgi:tripeptidyl-peptidase I
MVLPLLLAAFVSIHCCFASPISSKYVLHERRSTSPSSWVPTARVEGDTIIPVRIGLTQQNLDKGYDYLMELSDPKSPKYGKHWTPEQVHDAFAPADDAEKIVKEWLVSSGIEEGRIKHYENRGWLAFDAPAAEVEALLLAKFYEHEHTRSDKIRIGCSR